MKKRICLLFVAYCFFAALLPADGRAAGQADSTGTLKNLMLSMRFELQNCGQGRTAGFIAAETDYLLAGLLSALEQDDTQLAANVVREYASRISALQSAAPATSCEASIAASVLGDAAALLLAVPDSDDAKCLVINVSDSIANIISAILTYQICVIDQSQNPDNATRQQLVRKQVVADSYSFIASVLSIFLCKDAVYGEDIVYLYFHFLDIIPNIIFKTM